MLSALSKQSLLRYCRALKNHLAKLTSGFDVGDLAFSLTEKTQRYRFLCTTTNKEPDGLLESLPAEVEDVIEFPQCPRSIVLAFSGQNRQVIGFHKALYDSCHLLRKHLDHCNHELTTLGISDLLPAIFAEQPLEDMVLLQCGLFAVQYACASSWISSGLKVDGLVGHSFGELTAMAVSGILELRDALIIVAARARFMDSKWGSERGTMLVIHEKAELVSDLIARLPQPCRDVEIACYNAQASHVVVGAEASVMEVERLLKTRPSYAGIKCRRLNVSHGFRSRFTEGFLEDLDNVVNSVTFHVPKIPLETCTQLRIDRVSCNRISQHIREPVYFYQAVQRLEDSLGSCIWLEAGIDSPIMSMVKQAVESPKAHVFQALKYDERADPLSSISKTTEMLWRDGINVSYWSFYQVQYHGFRHVWLPPYQFENERHWLPYLDRAAEVLQCQASSVSKEVGGKCTDQLPKLLVVQDEQGQFEVNTATKHFSEIVSGHSVLRNPLCPASMYMECATMAAQTLSGNLQGKALWFESLSFDAPLGLDPSREVFLSVKADGTGWSLDVQSSYRVDGRTRSTVHCKGRFGFRDVVSSSQAPHLESSQRFVTSCLEAISDSPTTEVFKTQRAYRLFSHVVNYSDILRRISSITIAWRF